MSYLLSLLSLLCRISLCWAYIAINVTYNGGYNYRYETAARSSTAVEIAHQLYQTCLGPALYP